MYLYFPNVLCIFQKSHHLIKSDLPSSRPSTIPGEKMGKYLEIAFVFQPWNVSLESQLFLVVVFFF